eukprot:c16404_g1_i1 orf=117-392(+)
MWAQESSHNPILSALTVCCGLRTISLARAHALCSQWSRSPQLLKKGDGAKARNTTFTHMMATPRVELEKLILCHIDPLIDTCKSISLISSQ